MFVGSDALALSPMTSRITYLEEGDWAVITRAGAEVFDSEGNAVDRDSVKVEVDASQAEKGSYRHFMAKEIHEQPSVLADVLGRYVTPDRTAISSPAAELDWASMPRMQIVACGTASYAGMVAKYWFERLAGLPVEVDIASEFRYRDPPLMDGEVALFISQSGETADTLAALRHVQGRVAKTVGLVNVIESTIAREVDMVLPTLAGREIGVASTKAFTCQLLVLAATAILAARARGKIDADGERALVAKLLEVPRLTADAMAGEARIARVAQEMANARDILYLGRGPMFPIALEGALKLKEISYIHAAGHASGELKHGPIAMVDESVPVVVMAPKDPLFDKTISNMQEVLARGGKVALVTDSAGGEEGSEGAWQVIQMPDCDPLVQPIIHAIPAQLLAYHAALAKGTDVDQPRNLAKSVTVE